MAQLDLQELREAIRAHPKYVEWRKGEDANLYIRIGPDTTRTGFRSETRMGADGREVIFDIDDSGRLRGIEFQ